MNTSASEQPDLPPPRVTVITVCLNEVESIERTIHSMLQQERHQVEWLVFDGGSTDGTLEKLQKHAAEIRMLHSGADGGIYPAMNRAAEHASGDYLLFLNGGDCFQEASVLKDFVDAGFSEALVCGDVEVKFPEGRTQYRPASDIGDLKERLWWRSLPHISTFIRREVFAQLGGYDCSYSICADWEYFLRVQQAGGSFRAWSHPVGVFYFDGLSASESSSARIRLEKQRMRKHYPFFYRLRRGFNEWVGVKREQLRQQAGTQAETPGGEGRP